MHTEVTLNLKRARKFIKENPPRVPQHAKKWDDAVLMELQDQARSLGKKTWFLGMWELNGRLRKYPYPAQPSSHMEALSNLAWMLTYIGILQSKGETAYADYTQIVGVLQQFPLTSSATMYALDASAVILCAVAKGCKPLSDAATENPQPTMNDLESILAYISLNYASIEAARKLKHQQEVTKTQSE